MQQENVAIVRSVYEQSLNHGHMDRLDAIVAPEFTAPDGSKGPAGFRRTLEGLRRAFPDIQFTIHDAVADDERVAIRWTWTGTHSGPFRGIAPSNRRVSNNGFAMFRLRDGKIVDSKVETDRLGFLDAIGMLPPELSALARPQQ